MSSGSETNVNDALCRARVKANEQRIKRNEQRLEKHDATLVSVAECLTKLTTLYEVWTTEREEINTRLHTLETKPINRWEKIITGIISGGGGAVIGALLTQLFL